MKPAQGQIPASMLTRPTKPRLLAATFIIAISFGCAGERNAPGALTAAAFQIVGQITGGTCGDFYLDEISSTISFAPGSTTAGETSGLDVYLSFPDSMATPILATYEVVITVPPEFTFLGFDALGIQAPIGAWDFDFFADGQFDNADFTITHRGIDFDSAYSDSDASGSFTAVDPTAEYATGTGGEHIITLTLPDGGIEPFRGNCSYFAFDARYTLLDGLLRLPTTPGDYTIDIMATSVDLDTGNATDNVPPDPMTFSSMTVVTVPEPDGAPLAGVSLITIMALVALKSKRGHDPQLCERQSH